MKITSIKAEDIKTLKEYIGKKFIIVFRDRIEVKMLMGITDQ